MQTRAMEALSKRVEELEMVVGIGAYLERANSVTSRMETLGDVVVDLQESMRELETVVENRCMEKLEAKSASQLENLMEIVAEMRVMHRVEKEGLQKQMEELKAEVEALRKSVGSSSGVSASGFDNSAMKFKIPKPKHFEGARSSKEIENFIWDLEQYFDAAQIPEVRKVVVACMYLDGDAKLWWRTKVTEDVQAGRPRIET